MTNDEPTKEFLLRRQQARVEVNRLDAQCVDAEPDRRGFFEEVYNRANSDAAQVPWADMKPKDKLVKWLSANPGNGRTAIDIACGLGDNAEALSGSGYKTTAFDLSTEAVKWACQRFPETSVSYLSADLFEPLNDWIEGFDLVHECYTLQALPPEMFSKTATALASLVKPGGRLLVYTRIRDDNAEVSGPPWPLTDEQVNVFQSLGFESISNDRFDLIRPDKIIPHRFVEWQKHLIGKA